MSYREEVMRQIAHIPAEESNFDKKVYDIVRDTYTRALREAKVTGQSIESVTYEILEGIDEALRDRNEYILQNITDLITQIIHEDAHACIDVSEKKVEDAHAAFYETIEKEKAHLSESLEAFKAFAKEHAFHRLASHLHASETKIKTLLKNLSERK